MIGGVITAMATPFDEEGRVDKAAARRLAEPPGRARVARGRRRRLDRRGGDARRRRAHLAAAGDRRRDRRRGDGDLRHRHQRHPPLDRADQGGGRGRCRGGAGRHPVLQQAQLRRHPRPLRGDRRRRAGDSADRLQHPLAGGRQRAARRSSPSWPRSRAWSRSSRPRIASCDPIEGVALLAGNDDGFLPTLELGGAGGILVASHLVGDRRCGRCGMRRRRASWRGRARSTSACEELYDVLGITTNPIPLKAALEMPA